MLMQNCLDRELSSGLAWNDETLMADPMQASVMQTEDLWKEPGWEFLVLPDPRKGQRIAFAFAFMYSNHKKPKIIFRPASCQAM